MARSRLAPVRFVASCVIQEQGAESCDSARFTDLKERFERFRNAAIGPHRAPQKKAGQARLL